eukprot:GFYU01023391.1.p1 GENE.GFYU01023391.1~~GFYU01023391.1.p1  ORF type:complete len:225 (-),score=28.75 GFYU01023391.1:36-710(-)
MGEEKMVCTVCASQAKSRCGNCKGVAYCGAECQKVDWKLHKLQCKRLKAEAEAAAAGSMPAALPQFNRPQSAPPSAAEVARMRAQFQAMRAGGMGGGGGYDMSMHQQYQQYQHQQQEEESEESDLSSDEDDGVGHQKLAEPDQWLFPREDVATLMATDKADYSYGRPCGIRNAGNTCYANSVLQCMAATRPLATHLLSEKHSKTCRCVDLLIQQRTTGTCRTDD